MKPLFNSGISILFVIVSNKLKIRVIASSATNYSNEKLILSPISSSSLIRFKIFVSNAWTMDDIFESDNNETNKLT